MLNLKEVPIYNNVIYASICEGETYTDYNFNCTTPNTYTQTHQSIGGCDSTVTLVLTVKDSYSFDISASICEGETYSGYGITAETAGDYIRRYETIDGCDSVYNIHVTVCEPTDSIVRTVINYGDSYTWDGVTYKENTYLTKTLKNAAGCDSTVVFNLIVNDLITKTFYESFCEGDSVKIFDDETVIKEEGIYQRTYKAASGADSIAAYNVEMRRRTYAHTEATINAGETFPWHGKDYTQSVSLRDTLVNAEGCDSVCTLSLTVLGQLTYTVRFENFDGSELQAYQSEAGEIPVYDGSTPVREKEYDELDNYYVFTFTGWKDEANTIYGADAVLPAVENNVTYTAQYGKQLHIILQENRDAGYYSRFHELYNGLRAATATLNRQFGQGKWSTLCLPFNVPTGQLTSLGIQNRIFEFRYTKGDAQSGLTLYFSQAKKMEAGKGYIINANATLARKTSFIFANASINTDADAQSGFDIANLEGYNSQGYIYLVGTLRTGTLYVTEAGNKYMGLKDNKIYYPNSTQGTDVRAYRGIFRNTGEESQAVRVRIVAVGEDGETVSELEVIDGSPKDVTATRKFVRDGILYIERNGVCYTAQGQLLD